jgi:hypothetical protein
VIRSHYWHQVPTQPLRDVLPSFAWKQEPDCSAARDCAALMLYVALFFMREEHVEEAAAGATIKRHIANASYEALGHATGLSRLLIRQGLERLEALGLITPQGSHQKRRYELGWTGGSWFKLPCRAIVKDGVITPFRHFHLRAKHELHALKLYLYLASIRGNTARYSQASYEKIYERMNIPERDIRRAIAFLINAGLVRNVEREGTKTDTSWGANKYYLAGDHDLFHGTMLSPERVPA